MDDTTVFRRFFVMSNILAEIISGLSGAGMASAQSPQNPASFGPAPFSPQVQQSQKAAREQDFNTTYGFPTG